MMGVKNILLAVEQPKSSAKSAGDIGSSAQVSTALATSGGGKIVKPAAATVPTTTERKTAPILALPAVAVTSTKKSNVVDWSTKFSDTDFTSALTSGSLAFLAPALLYVWSKAKSPYTKQFEKNCVYVYQYPRAGVIPNLSPHCLALETFLRIWNIKYENVLNNLWLVSKNGHLPFVEMNGQETGGLKSILNLLSQKFPKSGEEQKNEDKELDDVLDMLYWIHHFYRYNNANCRALFQKKIGGKSAAMVPFMPHTRAVFAHLVLSNEKSYYTENKNDIVGQISNFVNDKVQDYFKRKNVSVNQPAKIKEKLIGCLEKLKSRLADKSYFSGDNATAMDAKIFGLLAQLYYVPLIWPHDKLMKEEFKSLYEFCRRIRDAFWPDWELIMQTGRSNTACEYFDFSTKK